VVETTVGKLVILLTKIVQIVKEVVELQIKLTHVTKKNQIKTVSNITYVQACKKLNRSNS